MGNIIAERIRNIKLTKAQERIADYCIRNLEWVGMSSSMEVAKAIGVSDVSMTRFARTIGYAGFTEFKNDIYNSIARQASGVDGDMSILDRASFSSQKYGDKITAEEYYKVLRTNMERTLKNNSSITIDSIIESLMTAEHRYIVGFRGCFGVASQCGWLMRFVADHVITVNDEGPDCIGRLQDVTSRDCVLMFSLARFYRIEPKLLELVHKRGARICLITNSAVSPLLKYADVSIIAETETASFFNSAMSFNMLSEYLITGMFQRSKEIHKERIKERDSITEYLRL